MAEQRQIAFGEESPAERARFAARPNEALIARLTDVRARVARGDAQVLDDTPLVVEEGVTAAR